VIALFSIVVNPNQDMANTILQKSVRPTRVILLDQKSAQALSETLRMRILEILNHKPMSAEEIAHALEGFGHKKAVTTIRHHLDALKNAGLVEATRMVEVRGAVLKYYAPTVRAFGLEMPQGFETSHAKLIQDTSVKIQKLLRSILADKRFANEFERHSVVCRLCKNNHLQEYAAAEILNHALAMAMDVLAGENAIAEESKPSTRK
jgi:DNA-binding transcriptional ArsR family regulator